MFNGDKIKFKFNILYFQLVARDEELSKHYSYFYPWPGKISDEAFRETCLTEQGAQWKR